MKPWLKVFVGIFCAMTFVLLSASVFADEPDTPSDWTDADELRWYSQLFQSRAWLKEFPHSKTTESFPWNIKYAVFLMVRDNSRESFASGVVVFAYSPTEDESDVYVFAFIALRNGKPIHWAFDRGFRETGTGCGDFERREEANAFIELVQESSLQYSNPGVGVPCMHILNEIRGAS